MVLVHRLARGGCVLKDVIYGDARNTKRERVRDPVGREQCHVRIAQGDANIPQRRVLAKVHGHVLHDTTARLNLRQDDLVTVPLARRGHVVV